MTGNRSEGREGRYGVPVAELGSMMFAEEGNCPQLEDSASLKRPNGRKGF
jgi:hypothetical protein